MRELAAVSGFDPVNGKLSLILFVHLKLPITELILDLDEPDTMLRTMLAQCPDAAHLGQRMRTHLVAMFHDARHSQATGNPEVEDVNLLLAVTNHNDEELTTLYQKRDRKVARMNRLLLQWIPGGKPRFVMLLFDKLLHHASDPQLMDRFVSWCCSHGQVDKLMPWITYPLQQPGCSEETILMLIGICMHHRKYDTALQLSEQILQKNYGNVQALISKAQCMYQLGQADFLVFIQKAFHFNKRITVETVSRRFEFRKDTRMDMFDVMSLKDAVVFASIPADAVKRLDLLSLPFRTESIQGSVYFVKEELEAWKNTMDALNIVSGRFGG